MVNEENWAVSEVGRPQRNNATKAKAKDNFKIYSWVLNTLWWGKSDWDKATSFLFVFVF